MIVKQISTTNPWMKIHNAKVAEFTWKMRRYTFGEFYVTSIGHITMNEDETFITLKTNNSTYIYI